MAMVRKEFERVTPESVGIRSKDIMELLDECESGFTELHGLQIMRYGKICAEGWWQPYAPGIVHGLQSLTKTYAATAVGIAVTEGLVRLEDRIIDIFAEEAPKEPGENLKLLTVRDVLCMGCGMDVMSPPSKDWIRDFLATPVNHRPGTTFMYNSTGSTLLGAIVRKLTGIGLHDYLKPRLFDKIGVDAARLKWFLMTDGMEVGGGGLFATTEDNLRLMKLYADGGVCNGERILSEDYVKKATSLQNDSATEVNGNPNATDNFLGYGFQIWKCKPEGVYRADGAMGQFAIVVPHKEMILSINETAGEAHWAQKTLDAIWSFLEKVGDAPLAENTAESGRLKKRLSVASLPAPRFAPYSPEVLRINGVCFSVTQGEFGFESNIEKMMAGNPVPNTITAFTFHFGVNSCKMEYTQNGERLTALIALDGTRQHNRVQIKSTPCTELYLHGEWVSRQTFRVTSRWVETCFEKQFDFTFMPDEVLIAVNCSVGRFGPMGANTTAARAKS